MLIWLGNKGKNIASTAMAIFVGSWLLLFCQTCFATQQDINTSSFSESEEISHCHTPDEITEKPDTQYNFDKDHCLGVCDCDVTTASLNSIDKKGLVDKLQKKLSDDNSIAYISPGYRKVSSTTYLIPAPPERAILLPLQHYTVLLN